MQTRAGASLCLLSCAQDSEGLLVTELRREWPDAPIRWVANGIALIEAPCPFELVAARLDEIGCVFARHVAPVDVVVPIEHSPALLVDAVTGLAGGLTAEAPYSVQVRSRGAAVLPAEEARRRIEDAALHASSAPFDRAHPRTILSVLLADGTAYAGASDVAHNRSSWPGGERRFRDGPERISRSEFKLLEALEVFELTLPQSGSALDLGAAPGGWTRVLLEHGLRVTAIDPAALDARVAGRVDAHVRSRALAYLPHAPQVDFVANDMRVGATESVDTMLAASQALLPGGSAVATLKLPETGRTSRALCDEIRRHLDRLRARYDRVRARQLFHNRSEITVEMRMSI